MATIHETPRSLLQRLGTTQDDGDWRRLVDLYTPLVRRWVQQYGVAEHDADDFIQEVFQTLVREIESFDHNGHTGAFRRWLRSTLVNRLRGFWRKRANQQGVALDPLLQQLEDPASDPNLLWEREHDQHVARRLLELLEPEFTPSTWLAFRRQVLDEQKAADVARELGTTPNAVLIAKSRVLKRFRAEVHGLVDE